MQRCFYEIPEVLCFFSFFFFFATRCRRMTDCLVERTEKPFCVPLPPPDPPFKIFIHKLPGAFYSTSNIRPTGEALSRRIQIGEKSTGGAMSEALLNKTTLNIYALHILLIYSFIVFFGGK